MCLSPAAGPPDCLLALRCCAHAETRLGALATQRIHAGCCASQQETSKRGRSCSWIMVSWAGMGHWRWFIKCRNRSKFISLSCNAGVHYDRSMYTRQRDAQPAANGGTGDGTVQ